MVELKTRNASRGGRVPSSAQAVPLVELARETAELPKGQTLPCLAVWRASSDRPDGPFAPRVRWISTERDYCVNLPAWAAEPGKIASRVPLAMVQDVFMLGFVSSANIMTPFGLSAAADAIESWEGMGDEPPTRKTHSNVR